MAVDGGRVAVGRGRVAVCGGRVAVGRVMVAAILRCNKIYAICILRLFRPVFIAYLYAAEAVVKTAFFYLFFFSKFQQFRFN